MPADSEVLFTPHREYVATTNAWAFLHWLRATAGIRLDGWAALQAFSAAEPAAFRAAVGAFARLEAQPTRLVVQPGTDDALILRRGDGTRRVLSRDALSAASLTLPADVAAPLTRFWPPARLIGPLAELLLHADLRPDDRMMVAGSPSWPWLAALRLSTTAIVATTPLLETAAEERASVMVAPAGALSEAAFPRPGRRPDLGSLRSIIAVGGPLSPEGRARIYTWIKPDLMLLARSGDTVWGNPLEPVRARPPAMPAFFRPPRSVPARGRTAPRSSSGFPPP